MQMAYDISRLHSFSQELYVTFFNFYVTSLFLCFLFIPMLLLCSYVASYFLFLVSFYVARSEVGGCEAGWQRLGAHASVEARLWSVRPWMAVSWQTINSQLRMFLCCMFLSMLLVCFYVAHLFLCC